ncbi:Cytochrome b-c1 complex subunit 9 [Lecanosticta acicola]|uniref:Complex III subunit 9 n=1 Tax=Lecanosticta acicola TaxID=111012 RepID=A0AAI8Z470_9PEZI|nr:Cytochrome b-c1 complex subunit 9 [Lecanosticta acicola]
MSGILGGLYNTIVKRNFVFLGTIFAGAFVTEIAFDTAANSIWNRINQGRQWQDIKYRYMQAGDDEDGDDDDE